MKVRISTLGFWDLSRAYSRWTHVSVWVACSRYKNNDIDTEVRFDAGGYLVIRAPDAKHGSENYIDVYSYNGNRQKWYRCGEDGSATYY
uniref:Uncharacterized protein n=1 Tax=Panagrolaimus davidi TaxID=227884 RepID=A0A914Q041_9BILA